MNYVHLQSIMHWSSLIAVSSPQEPILGTSLQPFVTHTVVHVLTAVLCSHGLS
jgi:hypothetical protein